MKTFFLLTLIASVLKFIDASSFGELLLARLNSELSHINNLILLTQQYYREEKNYQLNTNPKHYEDAMNYGISTILRAQKLIKEIENGRQNGGIDQGRKNEQVNRSGYIKDGKTGVPLTRRSNTQLQFKNNFYKALSRALKKEFPNDPLIQEHIHDGFVPPTVASKPVEGNFD